MTPLDLQDLLDALAQQCPVKPSELIEDAVDVELNDTRISLQWSEDASLIELTLALPPVIDPSGRADAFLPLFRALLERQWAQWGGENGLSFGLLPGSNDIVAMTSLSTDALIGPDDFLALLHHVTTDALAEWYGICGPLLLQQNENPPAEPGQPPHPAGPAWLSA